VLESPHLTLRELTEADLPAWFARRTDPEAAALAGDPIVASMQALVDGLHHYREAFRAKTGIRWSIVPRDVGTSAGTIGYSEFLSDPAGAVVGAAIGRGYWGRGLATQAGEMILEYAFTSLGLEHVWAVVLPENGRVARVLEKLAFVRADVPRLRAARER
jgi:ribosomal-protein-alanine N-acetyltransferase